MFNKITTLSRLSNKFKIDSKYHNCVKIFHQRRIYKRPLYSDTCFTPFHSSTIFTAKIFLETENAYLYKILPSHIYNFQANKSSDKTTINNTEELYAILDKNWRVETASSIVNCFRNIQEFCTENNINISDAHFDKLVDGLMDHVEKLTDEEMIELLETLIKYPKTDTYQSHNFHDVWSALDDICCSRIPSWNKDMLFRIADLWYNLQCGKLCQYVFDMLEKLTKISKHMNVDDLVRCFFFFNVVRRKPIEFTYETAVRDKITCMTVDQMAIVALGFFKTKCRIKLPEIITGMIEAVVKNKETVDDVTLCGILKAVRFSANVRTADQTYLLLDALVSEIDRITWECVLHTALLGTSMQIYHPEATEKCCEKFLIEYHDRDNTGRLKDVERLLIPVTMFNHTTEAGAKLVKTVFDDLHLPYRRKEMAQYPRCAPSALMYCSMTGLYSNTLMNEFLNKDFIKETYGNGRSVSKDLFSLDASIDIDCPDYPLDGARIGAKERRKAAKWQCEWKPNEIRNKPTALESIALDMGEHVAAILGGHDKYMWMHVLPQYSKADLVVCKNVFTNTFIHPPLDNFGLGDVVKAPNVDNEDGSKLEFYAIILLGWNHVVRRTNDPLGQMVMKHRQLTRAGYKPIFVLWSDFRDLSTENKTKYIKSLLNL